MKVSTKTRYGVRAMFDIAFHNRGNPTQAKDIARRQEVPIRYLEQIFQDLRRAGLVDSKRGPRGGYFLARQSTEIRLGDVVRAMQGPIEDLLCADDDAPETRPRRSKEVPGLIWRELAAKISACLDELTLADLCERGERLGLRRDGHAPMYFI